jgi:gamma-butyrobetaine dioxygenase
MPALRHLEHVERESALRLSFGDHAPLLFPLVWLRDNCASGFHPLTHERTFDLLSLPDDPGLDDCQWDEHGIRLVWSHDGQVSQFSAQWLWDHRPGVQRHDAALVPQRLWRVEDLVDGPSRHEATAVMQSDSALLTFLQALAKDGLAVVHSLVGDGRASVALAERIGFLRQTNFGLTFEVVNMPDPNNLAYTSLALPLHTDLPNQEMPPGLQFLHCIANEASGGDSVFADGFAMARDLKAEHPEAFAVLSQVSVPFRFFDREHDIRIRRPVITLDPSGRMTDLRFNAHITDLIDLPSDVAGAWYQAYRRLMRLTRSPEYRLTFKMRSGEMVAFDNRRVLHGRTEFDPASGKRHLHGCYVDRGEFESRLRMLQGG